MRVQGTIAATIIIAACLVACSKNEPSEPVDGVAFSDIDPNQKALPKESSDMDPAKPVTDVTLDGKGEQIGDVTPSLEATPAPTPTVDEITSSPVNSPETAINDAATSAAPKIMGTGNQRRYIKAWELNIRSQPNRFSKIVGRLNGGDEVNVTIRGGWAKLDDGKWIRSRWLVKNRPSKFVGGPADDNAPAPRKKSKQSKKSKQRSRKPVSSKK